MPDRGRITPKLLPEGPSSCICGSFLPFSPRLDTRLLGLMRHQPESTAGCASAQIIGRCGKGKHPAHLLNSPLSQFPQERDIKHSSILFQLFWLMSYPMWRVVRSSMAPPPLRLVFCATCGHVQIPALRHKISGGRIPCRLQITRFTPSICSSITRAASR